MINENTILEKEIKNTNIEILRFAHADLTSTWRTAEHVNPFNNFYLITKGEADVWCNGRHYHMTPGNIYVLATGSIVSASCPEAFSKLYFCANLRNSNREALPIAPPEGFMLPECDQLIKKMVKLYHNTDYHSALCLRFYAEQLIMDVFRRSTEKTEIPNRSPLVSKTLRIINTAPHMTLSAEVLSEMVCASVSTLRKKFKKETGVPLGKYVQERVLDAAAHDLQYSEISLSDISIKYGFCDQFYFSNCFAARFGISPSKYRKEHII